MKQIFSTDLWTEQYANHQDITSGAFVDGVGGVLPYDTYKIVKNCNCIITSNSKKVIVGNKHQAIVFYNQCNVIRLVALEKNTDLMQCVDKALSQKVGNLVLEELLAKHKVKKEVVDMREQAIFTKSNTKEQMDVGSCDRLPLLKSMLEGSYTESETEYGNSDRSAFKYYADICVNYHLVTDKEVFDISHKGAFINKTNTRIIPIQVKGSITENNLKEVLIK